MNKQTKTLLGVAVVAGVGYYLWKMQSEKKKPASFANLVSDPVKMTSKCNGDYGKDAEGRYICCRAGYRSNASDGNPCGGVGQLSDEGGMDEMQSLEF
jgi:hypothetical protein